MKRHLTVKLRNPVPTENLPHWQELLANQSLAVEQLCPEIDALLQRHRRPVLATREYQPAAADWSLEELQSGLNRVYRLILKDNLPWPPGLINEIQLLPNVERVGAGEIAEAPLPEPHASSMSRGTGDDSRRAIQLDLAHAFTQGSSSITVAVLDTGVSVDHPELRASALPGYDFVDILNGAEEFFGDSLGADPQPEDFVGHGTHVAGIITGAGRAMPKGVAPRCKLLPVRVLGALKRGNDLVGAGLVDNINSGVKWAVDQGADVINMSLGVEHSAGGLPHEEVCDYARRKGVSLVAASGNDGQEKLYYPGALPHVVAVGATDETGDVASFSTYGDQVDFIAPGTAIYSSFLEGSYAFSTGTSHAAPFVAGGICLLKSYAKERGKQLSDRQVKHILKHTADRPGRRLKERKSGYGQINLSDALRLLEHKLQ